MAADLTPQQAQALLPMLQKINKLYVDSSKAAQLIFNATKGTVESSKGENAIRVEVLKNYQTEYATLKKMKDLGGDIYKQEKQRLQTLVDMDVKLDQYEATLSNINLINEKNMKTAEKEIDIMKKKGQMAKAYFAEVAMNARRSFQTESGHTTGTSVAQGSANAVVGAHGVANDPASALTALGPWGAIIKIIADVIDGARMMGAALHTASAESGGFASSFGTAAKEAMNITEHQTELMARYGMTTEEVQKIYGELKSTGIAALGVVPQTGDAMSDLANDVMSFAKASNQATAQVAGQMAQLVRTNGIAKNKLTANYDKIFSAADRMAQKGQASMSEVVQATFSMNEQFSDMGMNISGISDVIEGVGDALKKLGRPEGIGNITKISEGILGLSKATEGWKVLMGQMGGIGGGFLNTLFKMQQRGTDLMNPKANSYNPMQDIQMFQATTSKLAASPDPRMRQLLTEKIGGQMGMDSSTVQVMQNLNSGKISQSKALVEMKKLHEAAKENNMSSKGMFDIIRNILVGMIAYPLMGIWKYFASGKEEKAQAASMQAAVGKASRQTGSTMESGRNEVGITGKSLYSDANRSGGIRVSSGGANIHIPQNQIVLNQTLTVDKNGMVHIANKEATKVSLRVNSKQNNANQTGRKS